MMNDVWGLEMRPVNIWLEQERVHILLLDLPVQVTIEGELECLTAVCTLGFDFDRKSLVM